jgi:transposase
MPSRSRSIGIISWNGEEEGMAGRRKPVLDVREILRRFKLGQGIREVARELSIDRKTVRAYRKLAEREGWLGQAELPTPEQIDQAVAGRTSQCIFGPASSVESYREKIAKHHAAGVEAQAIWGILKEEDHFTGSYDAVKRFVRRLRKAAPEGFVRVETGIGEEAQVDFGWAGKIYDPTQGRLRKAWVFVMTLSWSRHQYAEIVFDQKVETWIALHIRAFEFFGGISHRVRPDFVPGNKIRLMCPPAKCGRDWPKGRLPRRSARSRTHNGLEGVQPGKQRFVVLPDCTRAGSLRSPQRRLTRSHRRLLGAQGKFGVAVRGLQTHVPQPGPDHVDLDARLEKMDRGSMPEEVRADAPWAVARAIEKSGMPTDDLVDAEARERNSGPRTEDRAVRLAWLTRLLKENAQLGSGFRPEGTRPPLIPFPVQLNTGLGAEVEVTHPQVCGLLNPGAGIVEKEDQGAIALGMPSISGQLLKELGHIFALQEVSLGRRDALDGDRGNALARVEHLRLAAAHIVEERAEGRQPLIPGTDVVPPLLLEMFEEGEGPVEGELLEAKAADGPLAFPGDETEEEAERIAVAAHGSRT